LIDKAKKYVIAIGKINTSELQNTRSGKREYFVKKVAHKIKNIAYHFNADVTVGKLLTSKFKSHKKKANGISDASVKIKHICVKNDVICKERSEANTTKISFMLSHILGLDVHKCASIAFALKLLDFQLFKSLMLLSGVISYEADRRQREAKERKLPYWDSSARLCKSKKDEMPDCDNVFSLKMEI